MAMRICVSDMLRPKPFSVCDAVTPTAPAPAAVPQTVQPPAARQRTRRTVSLANKAKRTVMKRSALGIDTADVSTGKAASLVRQHHVRVPGIFQVVRPAARHQQHRVEAQL